MGTAIIEAEVIEETGLARPRVIPHGRVSDLVRHYMRKSKSENTLRGYELDFARFVRWCHGRGRTPLPSTPETVAEYVAHRANQGRKLRTVTREMAAIRFMHVHYRQPDGRPLPTLPTAHPDVKRAMEGIARELGSATKKAPPILLDDLRAMVEVQDLKTNRGCRDAALLLVGWWGCMRRSEILSREVAHIEYKGDRDMVIVLDRQKNDQRGEGMRKVYRPPTDRRLCARSALERWLRRSGIEAGAIFRPVYNGDSVGREAISGRCADRIVKRAARLAGLETVGFSSHSLRAGFITAAAQAGKPLHIIQQQSGHKSLTTLSGYIRVANELGDDCATAGLA